MVGMRMPHIQDTPPQISDTASISDTLDGCMWHKFN